MVGGIVHQKTRILDCNYVLPQFAAAYLLKEGPKGAFVETNTTHCVPLLLSALQEESLNPEAIELIIITHVHLDHAGGSSALMKACPNATLLAHPKAAAHLIDPSKLIRSAKSVYGEENFRNLYGEIEPIPSHRVRIIQDREDVSFGNRRLHFFYTKGHANHHFCVHDSSTEGIFTGDSFGLAYPAVQKKGLLIIPSTSPTDFDPVEARTTILKILEMRPKKIFLTHFGELVQVEEAANQLRTHLDFSEKLLNKAIKSEYSENSLIDFCEKEIKTYFQKYLETRSLASDKSIWEILKYDLKLNASGIAYSAMRARKEPRL